MSAESKIRERMQHLERSHGRITSCHVKVEAPHLHGHHGKIFQVSIDVRVPGGEVAVSNAHELNHAHENLMVAIRDSFDATEPAQGSEAHEAECSGRTWVRRSDETEEGYGFIETPDGREFYFDRDSLSAGAWEALTPGTEVRFTERDGDKGPFATAVSPAAKHG